MFLVYSLGRIVFVGGSVRVGIGKDPLVPAGVIRNA